MAVDNLHISVLHSSPITEAYVRTPHSLLVARLDLRNFSAGRRRTLGAVLLSAMLCLLLIPDALAQAAGNRYAVLIGGLGGESSYTEQFGEYLNETRGLLIDRAGFQDENVYVLGEEEIASRPFVDAVATAEEIREQFEDLAGRVTNDDHVFVILFGHGSYDGEHARLNIPRRDLDDVEYAAMIDGLEAGRVVVVNTASASGPFVEVLSADNRVVVTATASGTERNETIFPQFFVEALGSSDADLDKNGGLSVREAFTYAAQQTAQSYEGSGNLATEHAQMDDNGDGQGSRLEELDAAGDGHLASTTYIRPRTELASVSAAARPLLREKESVERSVAELKSRKDSMNEDAYYAELETLFVRLARLNEEMESTN